MGHCMFVVFIGDTHVTLSLARLITTRDLQGVIGCVITVVVVSTKICISIMIGTLIRDS